MMGVWYDEGNKISVSSIKKMATIVPVTIGTCTIMRKAKFLVRCGGVETFCISASHVSALISDHYGALIISPCDVYNALSSHPQRGKIRLGQRWPSDLMITKLSSGAIFGTCTGENSD